MVSRIFNVPSLHFIFLVSRIFNVPSLHFIFLMYLWLSSFRVGFIWERAQCQVVRRAVKLALFSSKSICNLCLAFGVQGTHLCVSCVQFALTADWEALGQF